MSLAPKTTANILADSKTLSSILVGGVRPAIDFNPHSPDDPQSDSDSFYVLSYLKADNHHRFTVLFHLMILNKPKPPGPASLLAMSILDESVSPPRLYFSKEVSDLGLNNTIVLPNTLNIQVFSDPTHTASLGHLFGTMNNLTVLGSAHDGPNDLEIVLTLTAIGPTLPDLGGGVIPFPGGLNYEYAFPHMDASGSLKLNGETYNVTGSSWFDREWGHLGGLKWTWMGIELDHGVKISLWDQQDFQPSPETYVGGRAFATILDDIGNLTVSTVAIEEGPLMPGANGQKYPKSWTVTIPGKCELTVETVRQGQDIVSMIPRLEAKSHVTGTYDNKTVKGDAFVEAGIIPPPPPTQVVAPANGQITKAAGQATAASSASQTLAGKDPQSRP